MLYENLSECVRKFIQIKINLVVKILTLETQLKSKISSNVLEIVYTKLLVAMYCEHEIHIVYLRTTNSICLIDPAVSHIPKLGVVPYILWATSSSITEDVVTRAGDAHLSGSGIFRQIWLILFECMEANKINTDHLSVHLGAELYASTGDDFIEILANYSFNAFIFFVVF
jgi:hypothetical protein